MVPRSSTRPVHNLVANLQQKPIEQAYENTFERRHMYMRMYQCIAACFAAGGNSNPPLTGRDFNKHDTLSASSPSCPQLVRVGHFQASAAVHCNYTLRVANCNNSRRRYTYVCTHLAYSRYLCCFAAVTRQQTSTLVVS